MSRSLPGRRSRRKGRDSARAGTLAGQAGCLPGAATRSERGLRAAPQLPARSAVAAAAGPRSNIEVHRTDRTTDLVR